jgi:hypothetical protein
MLGTSGGEQRSCRVECCPSDGLQVFDALRSSGKLAVTWPEGIPPGELGPKYH